jgi:predicted nucleic acid-binding protein
MNGETKTNKPGISEQDTLTLQEMFRRLKEIIQNTPEKSNPRKTK